MQSAGTLICLLLAGAAQLSAQTPDAHADHQTRVLQSFALSSDTFPCDDLTVQLTEEWNCERFDCYRSTSVVAKRPPQQTVWSISVGRFPFIESIAAIEEEDEPPLWMLYSDGMLRGLDCDGVTHEERPLVGQGCTFRWDRLDGLLQAESPQIRLFGARYSYAGNLVVLTAFDLADRIAIQGCPDTQYTVWSFPLDGTRGPIDGAAIRGLELVEGQAVLTTALYDPESDDGLYNDGWHSYMNYAFEPATGRLLSPTWIYGFEVDPNDASGHTVRGLDDEGLPVWSMTFPALVRSTYMANSKRGHWRGAALLEGTADSSPLYEYLDAAGEPYKTVPLGMPAVPSAAGTVRIAGFAGGNVVVSSELTKASRIYEIERDEAVIMGSLDHAAAASWVLYRPAPTLDIVICGENTDGALELRNFSRDFYEPIPPSTYWIVEILKGSGFIWSQDPHSPRYESGIVSVEPTTDLTGELLICVLGESGLRYYFSATYTLDFRSKTVASLQQSGSLLRAHSASGGLLGEVDLGGPVLHTQLANEIATALVQKGNHVEQVRLRAWVGLTEFERIDLSASGCALESSAPLSYRSQYGLQLLESTDSYVVLTRPNLSSFALGHVHAGAWTSLRSSGLIAGRRSLDGALDLQQFPWPLPAVGNCELAPSYQAIWNGEPPLSAFETTMVGLESLADGWEIEAGSGVHYALTNELAPAPVRAVLWSSAAALLPGGQLRVEPRIPPGPAFDRSEWALTFDPASFELLAVYPFVQLPSHGHVLEWELLEPGRLHFELNTAASPGALWPGSVVVDVDLKVVASAPPGETAIEFSGTAVRANDSPLPVVGTQLLPVIGCRTLDLDQDREITLEDVGMQLEAVVGAIELDAARKCSADADGNERVDVWDAYLGLRSVQGSTALEPAEQVSGRLGWRILHREPGPDEQLLLQLELRLDSATSLVALQLQAALDDAGGASLPIITVTGSELQASHALGGARRVAALAAESFGPRVLVSLQLPPAAQAGWLKLTELRLFDEDGKGYAPADLRIPLFELDPAPTEVRLLAATPNPFNPSTRIAFELPAATRVQLTIFDLRGRSVRVLHSGELPPGRHAFDWDGLDGRGRPASSGKYFAQLEAEASVCRQSLTLLK